MKIQLIRNATLKMVYKGETLLIDPMLSKKETMEPFIRGLQKNPTVNLTILVDDILKDIDAVLVTHSHPDHFDTVSSELLPKDIPIFATPTDKEFFAAQNFNNVTTIEKETTWSDIKITRIEGQHGSGPILPFMGKVSGFVLQAKGEPTIYIISDTIITENVKDAITHFQPQIIITNSGGGIFPGYEDFPVMVDEKQTIEIATLAPNSKLIAVHLESIDFCRTTRNSLREFASGKGVSENQLFIPKDGEVLKF